MSLRHTTGRKGQANLAMLSAETEMSRPSGAHASFLRAKKASKHNAIIDRSWLDMVTRLLLSGQLSVRGIETDIWRTCRENKDECTMHQELYRAYCIQPANGNTDASKKFSFLSLLTHRLRLSHWIIKNTIFLLEIIRLLYVHQMAWRMHQNTHFETQN